MACRPCNLLVVSLYVYVCCKHTINVFFCCTNVHTDQFRFFIYTCVGIRTRLSNIIYTSFINHIFVCSAVIADSSASLWWQREKKAEERESESLQNETFTCADNSVRAFCFISIGWFGIGFAFIFRRSVGLTVQHFFHILISRRIDLNDAADAYHSFFRSFWRSMGKKGPTTTTQPKKRAF